MEKVQLIDRGGNLFEEITIPEKFGKPECILVLDRVFLPAKKNVYREAATYNMPLPYFLSLQGR